MIHGLGRSFGERNSYPLQYSCLENFRDRGAWWARVHGVAKSGTRLSTHTWHGTGDRHGRDIVTDTSRGRDDRTRAKETHKDRDTEEGGRRLTDRERQERDGEKTVGQRQREAGMRHRQTNR